MLKIAVLISGSGSNLQAIIDEIEKGNIKGKIEIVISNNKNAYGLQRAKKHNIEAIYLSKEDYPSADDFDDEIIKKLKAKEIDLVVLAGYLKILTTKFIKTFENRIINIHPSLIPAFAGEGYYGHHVHQAAVKKGVKYSGATVHFVNEEVDGGYIIEQETVKVLFDDTAETLAKKVLEVEHKILVKVVKAFCEGKIKIIDEKIFMEE